MVFSVIFNNPTIMYGALYKINFRPSFELMQPISRKKRCSGSVVGMSNLGPEGLEFKPWPVRVLRQNT